MVEQLQHENGPGINQTLHFLFASGVNRFSPWTCRITVNLGGTVGQTVFVYVCVYVYVNVIETFLIFLIFDLYS